MAENSQLINVGTAEKPVMVPEKALHPESVAGQEWWEMLATGSVFLDGNELAQLLQYIEDNNQ